MHAGVTNLQSQAVPTLITTASHTHALLLLDNESSDSVARDASTITTSQSQSTHVPSQPTILHVLYILGEVYGTVRRLRRYRLVGSKT